MVGTCSECGTEFEAVRRDRKTCSSVCRSDRSRRLRGVIPKRPAVTRGMKSCVRCETVKPTSEFYWLNGSRKRYQSYCKPCHRSSQNEWKRKSRGLPADAVLKPGTEKPIGSTYEHRKYILQKVGVDKSAHHRANKNGWVPQHILVAERKYGIAIPRTMTVHHRNRDTRDNRPENLEIRVGNHGKGGDLMDTLLNDEAVRALAAVALRRYGYTVIDPGDNRKP